jgi:hypothetical protein
MPQAEEVPGVVSPLSPPLSPIFSISRFFQFFYIPNADSIDSPVAPCGDELPVRRETHAGQIATAASNTGSQITVGRGEELQLAVWIPVTDPHPRKDRAISSV